MENLSIQLGQQIILKTLGTRRNILCIHTNGGPSSVYARKLHNSSDATVKTIYGHEFGVYFGNIFRTMRIWVTDCLICTMVHQQVHIQQRGRRIALTNHGNRPHAHLLIDSITIGRLKMYASQRYKSENFIPI